MNKPVQTIVAMGIICAMFMAMMSMVYLDHVPGKADLDRLETDLRNEFGAVLSAMAPLKLAFLAPETEGRRLGVEVVCVLRADLRRRPTTVAVYLDRMAQSILEHPDWEGRIDLVTVRHAPPRKVEKTRRAPERP